MNQANNEVSKATKRNWQKLGVATPEGKLTSRANKRLSTKRITPAEYFDNKLNIDKIEAIAQGLSDTYDDTPRVLYSIGVKLFESNGIVNSSNAADNPLIAAFLNKYEFAVIEDLDIDDYPRDESDLLGLIYQCLMREGAKNAQGSYYTPKSVVRDMVHDLQLTSGTKVLDPCCGSLVYLLNIPGIRPENIFASDIDPTAVMIATFNYFLKFPDAEVLNIHTYDFLNSDKKNGAFDYIITNPPWGAQISNTAKYPEIVSGETFSCFLVEAHEALKTSGQLRFLLPESILNVKTHRDIRKYLLSNANLISIKMYRNLFTGVTTKYVALTAGHSGNARNVSVTVADRSWDVEKSVYENNPNYIFRLSDSTDESIIEKVLERKHYDLSASSWALGIVTGNNKEKLHIEPNETLEKIYTGKEIAPYSLKPAKYYIRYDRGQLQQVAKDEIYRATPKLVYKFISKKLVFAVDESASLFLNSANILVPNIPGMSVKSVSAFLNSELYQYLYMKLFREIKILKGNLLQLPFPEIDHTLDEMISAMVDNVIAGKENDTKLQDFIYDYYQISAVEIQCIQKEIYGPTDRRTKSRY